MPNDEPIQLQYVDKAIAHMMDWAQASDIHLHKIESIIPFVATDKSLEIWLFFSTDEVKKRYEQDGKTQLVKKTFLQTLQELNYPADYLSQVTFIIDSHENVVENYEGSYFYRLR